MSCIDLTPAVLGIRYSNILTAVLAGGLGALDAIPLDENDPLRKTSITLDEDRYEYNFPIELEDTNAFTFGYLDGTVKRAVRLLDENSKIKCVEKYEYMGKFLFPENWEIINATNPVLNNELS